MDQIGIIPSGVHQNSVHTLVASEQYVCYASTLAVYVHANKPGYPLLRVLTGPSKPIVGIAYDGEALVAPCEDRKVFLWELITGELLGTADVAFQPTCVAMTPKMKHKIVIGGLNGCLAAWLYREGRMMQCDSSLSGDIVCLNFSPNVPNLVGMGTTLGFFSIYDIAAYKVHKKIDAFETLRTGGFFDKVFGDSPCITDVAFDPLSTNYVILASITGYLILMDIESMQIMHTFDRCNTGIVRVTWIPNQPGSFLTVDAQTNTVRNWNVSSRIPLASLRPKNLPVRSCVVVPPSFENIMVAFDEGSVGVFNLNLKRLEMNTLPGHCETVFDARFAEHNRDLLSSGSFDRTIKVWNTKRMELETSILVGSVIYCIDWHPEGSQIGCSLHTGEVAVFNVATQKLVWKKRQHSDLAWRMTWNQLEPALMASTSRDKKLAVFRSNDGATFGTYEHPAPVFGVRFSPHSKTTIATGCHDGVIRILELESGITVKAQLKGHEADVYHVEWNPFFSNIIASSSNDKTVRVWDTTQLQQPLVKTLVGHVDKVRGLCWCPIAPYLLLSGAWDGTVRLWDCISGGCLATNHNHTADVYCLSMHPDRPGVLVSGSRDTTLRFWRLRAIDHAYLRASLGSLKVSNTPKAFMDLQSGTRATSMLLGPSLVKLLADVAKAPDALHRLELFANFFDFPHGAADVVNCVRYMVSGASSPELDAECTIMPMDVIATAAERRAKDLEKVRNRVSAVGGSQRDAKLVSAAEEYLRLGQVQKACELLIDAGEWERGLAMAPLVGLDYWRSLCLRSAERLNGLGDAKAVDFYIAACEGHKAAQFLAERGEHTEAMLVVQHCPQRKGDDSGAGDLVASSSVSALPPQVDARESTEKLGKFALNRAERHLAVGNPNLAAAAYASAGITAPLVTCLVRSGSVPLSQLIIHTVKMEDSLVDMSFTACMIRAAKECDWAAAGTACRRVRDRTYAAATLLALFRADPAPAGGHKPSVDDYRKELRLEEASSSAPKSASSEVNAIAELLAKGQVPQAINNGQSFLQDLVAQLQANPETQDVTMVQLLEARDVANWLVTSTDSTEVNRSTQRMAYLIGEHLATRLGMSCLVPSMLTAALFLMDDGIEKNSLQDRVRAYQVAELPSSANEYAPLGSHLPSNDINGKRSISFITDTEVAGPQVLLEDGKNVISAHEATMWTQCCWFSPLANIGQRLLV